MRLGQLKDNYSNQPLLARTDDEVERQIGGHVVVGLATAGRSNKVTPRTTVTRIRPINPTSLPTTRCIHMQIMNIMLMRRNLIFRQRNRPRAPGRSQGITATYA